MNKVIRIGTRDSQLAVWQATRVKELLEQNNFEAELIPIKSEGDIDLSTPLYEMGVQGIFTRSLDIALLNKNIDVAVHSMKDVPTQLPTGIAQCAVLPRASYKDVLVYKDELATISNELGFAHGKWSAVDQSITDSILSFTVATSSTRRKAQWLNRYPGHTVENLRGNINTRLRKVQENDWRGAIFAAAGLERINLRPENSIELDWMLPAPAQGAIVVVCRQQDDFVLNACNYFNDADTALCAKLERDFLRTLMGGCSTPISALAQIKNAALSFKGNILSLDGKEKVAIEKNLPVADADDIGKKAAEELLANGGKEIADKIQHAER
ncbi:MAG TPA: hydroxymethylbilane synthase [Chitinophagaceae bacterium]